MIDLFSFWFGGFVLTMVMNCTIVGEIRKEFPTGPAVLVVMAIVWPLLVILVLWALVRDR